MNRPRRELVRREPTPFFSPDAEPDPFFGEGANTNRKTVKPKQTKSTPKKDSNVTPFNIDLPPTVANSIETATPAKKKAKKGPANIEEKPSSNVLEGPNETKTTAVGENSTSETNNGNSNPKSNSDGGPKILEQFQSAKKNEDWTRFIAETENVQPPTDQGSWKPEWNTIVGDIVQKSVNSELRSSIAEMRNMFRSEIQSLLPKPSVDMMPMNGRPRPTWDGPLDMDDPQQSVKPKTSPKLRSLSIGQKASNSKPKKDDDEIKSRPTKNIAPRSKYDKEIKQVVLKYWPQMCRLNPEKPLDEWIAKKRFFVSLILGTRFNHRDKEFPLVIHWFGSRFRQLRDKKVRLARLGLSEDYLEMKDPFEEEEEYGEDDQEDFHDPFFDQEEEQYEEKE